MKRITLGVTVCVDDDFSVRDVVASVERGLERYLDAPILTDVTCRKVSTTYGTVVDYVERQQ
jgi:hypothetical protein